MKTSKRQQRVSADGLTRRLIVVAAAFLLSLATAAATWVTSEISYRRFTTQDGLPQMQAETVWQDSRGYIYIGTLSGFVRYDGRTMTPFLKGQRMNILAFRETGSGDYKSPSTDVASPLNNKEQIINNKRGGDVVAMGFRRQWFIDGNGGTSVTMRPIDPN